MKHAAVMLLTTLLAGSGIAAADTQYIFPGEGDTVQEDASSVMLPQRPHDVVKFIGQQAFSGEAKLHKNSVNSHIVYMNNCMPSGCAVHPGNDDATTDSSSIVSHAGTLSAWPYGASAWSSVMSCMTATMSRFNITVTDVDPGSQPHFEVMVAGTPGQLGLSNGVGGIAPVPCQGIGQCDAYLPNALVFDFAQVWQGDVQETCATAAQEIAHAWILDHVVDKTDPMTYNQYSGMRNYKDGMSCGSDCQGGQSPFGLTCTGSNDSTSTHACMANGQVTQNDVQMITALFGPAGAVAPSVAITAPANGATVTSGFKVDATCDTADGIAEVDLLVDNVVVATLTTSGPYEFTTSPSLAAGSHKLEVTCSTTKQAMSMASANVNVGSGCTTAAMCPNMTDICFNGACVAGMGATGGLGATCGSNPDCTSAECASDGTNKYCVIGCQLTGDNQCPAGYSCVSAGASGGVCFPGGGDGGGGGCLSASGSDGAFFLVLGGVVVMITRRRKRV